MSGSGAEDRKFPRPGCLEKERTVAERGAYERRENFDAASESGILRASDDVGALVRKEKEDRAGFECIERDLG